MNFSFIEKNLRKSQTNIKEEPKDREKDSLADTNPSYFTENVDPEGGEYKENKEYYPGVDTNKNSPEGSTEKKPKYEYAPPGGNKKKFLLNLNLNRSLNFDMLKNRDHSLSHNNSNDNIFNQGAFKFIPKITNTYNEKKNYATKTRNRNISANFDPEYFSNYLDNHQNINSNHLFNRTQINQTTDEIYHHEQEKHSHVVPIKNNISENSVTRNNSNYSFEHTFMRHPTEIEKIKPKVGELDFDKKINFNNLSNNLSNSGYLNNLNLNKLGKKIAPLMKMRNPRDQLNHSVDLDDSGTRNRRNTFHFDYRKAMLISNISFDMGNIISEKVKEENLEKKQIIELEKERERKREKEKERDRDNRDREIFLIKNIQKENACKIKIKNNEENNLINNF